MEILQSLRDNFAPGWDVSEYISVDDIAELCEQAETALQQLPSLRRLRGPARIFGDLHGSYEDLLAFERAYWWQQEGGEEERLIFIGDFVDRGAHSLEVALHLLALQLEQPERVVLLRGDHEDAAVNSTASEGDASLRSACQAAYTEAYEEEEDEEDIRLPHDAINGVFTLLPLAAVVDDAVFCAHGGIPRTVEHLEGAQVLDAIAAVERPVVRVNRNVYASDLLWGDPVRGDEPKEMFVHNKSRDPDGDWPHCPAPGRRATGLVYAYSKFSRAAEEAFFSKTGLRYFVRGHEFSAELLRDGHDVLRERVVTLHSCSNYMGHGNQATCALWRDGALSFHPLL